VQGRPATTHSTSQHPCDQPALRSTAHHQARALLFVSPCAARSIATTHAAIQGRDSSQAVWKAEEEYIGELLREEVHCGRFPVLLPERTNTSALKDSCVVGSRSNTTSQKPARRVQRLTTKHFSYFLSLAPSSRSSLDLIIGKSAKLHVVSCMAGPV
jgi:hypothetical protein